MLLVNTSGLAALNSFLKQVPNKKNQGSSFFAIVTEDWMYNWNFTDLTGLSRYVKLTFHSRTWKWQIDCNSINDYLLFPEELLVEKQNHFFVQIFLFNLNSNLQLTNYRIVIGNRPILCISCFFQLPCLMPWRLMCSDMPDFEKTLSQTGQFMWLFEWLRTITTYLWQTLHCLVGQLLLIC